MVDKADLLSLLFVESLHNPIVHKCKSLLMTKYHIMGKTSPNQILSDHFEEFMGILVPALMAENLSLSTLVKEQAVTATKQVIIQVPSESNTIKERAKDYTEFLQEELNKVNHRGVR